MERYLVTLKKQPKDYKKLADQVQQVKNTKVLEILEGIQMLIISTEEAQIPNIKKKVKAIKSIEKEGFVSTQE